MFLILRVFRRQSGALGMADLLVIVIIADAAQNGMAGDSKSVTEALLLIGTIIFWDWLFDWLGYKSMLFAKLLSPEPLVLVENGKVLKKNLDQEMITEEDLNAHLREQGLDDISKVRKACLESNGHISVLTESKRTKQKGNDSADETVN